MSVTEGIKGDALKFGFFIMREFFPKLEKGQSDGYRQNNYIETLYLIFDYPYKYYTFKHFEV